MNRPQWMPQGFADWATGRTFLSESRIDIDDFPFLFTLLNYAGFSGLFFSLIWFGILTAFYSVFSGLSWIIGGGILFGFAALMPLSSLYTNSIAERKVYGTRSQSEWNLYARRAMTFLIVLFTATCSVLIWFTGGISSPFIPFYVMVYTLALTRCKIPRPGRALTLLFILSFALAVLLAWKGFVPQSLNSQLLGTIRQGPEKEAIDFVFAVASMVVPYLSTGAAERRERRRRSDPPATPPPSEGNQNEQSVVQTPGARA